MQDEASQMDGSTGAWEAMAPVYDLFAAGYEYEAWLADLVAQLERHGLQRGRLLDVACGTGMSFLPMLARGWEVTGCDASAAMLQEAQRKADSVRLGVADMRALPSFGRFDLVWSLGNSLNCLLDGEELRSALTGMRRNLSPEGLLLFDLSTLLVYRTLFAERSTREHGGLRFVWAGQAPPDVAPGSICTAKLATEEGQGQRRELGVHRHRHFPEAEVREAIADAGLECLDAFGHDYEGAFKWPLSEAEHSTAVYIARIAR
jgi:ubiquinone/menaquinone biosynthesis C-methylase UbiE